MWALATDDGAVLWTFSTDDLIYSSAAVDNTRVYFGSDEGSIYAVNRADGELAWAFETGSLVRSSPVVDGERLYAGSYDDVLYALDVQTGDDVWTYLVGASTTTVAISGGRVYTTTIDGRLIALED